MARRTDTVQAGPNGASITVGPPAGQAWEVQQVSVSTSDEVPTPCRLYVNTTFIAASIAGQADAASDPPYLIIASPDTITVTWPQLAAGQSATAVIHYEPGYIE